MADEVIVGSAIVEIIEGNLADKRMMVGELVRGMKDAVCGNF